MKFLTKFTIIIIFISRQGFSADIQYFLSPYFFKNPQSYSVNGNQSIKYNLGELLSTAIEQTNNNFFPCQSDQISDAVINIYPTTFYNPATNHLQTDAKIRIYSLKNSNIEELLVQERKVMRLSANSEEIILEHYKLLSYKINLKLSDMLLETEIKMNGEICKSF